MRVPPNSQEAEAGVLGSMLISPYENIERAKVLHLRPEHFYDHRNQALFEAMCDMDTRFIDTIIIGQTLSDTGALDKIGGYDRLIELQSDALVSGHIESYAEIVKEKYRARRLIEHATDAIDDAYKAKNPDMVNLSLVKNLEGEQPEIDETLTDIIAMQLDIDRKIVSGERVGVPLPWFSAQQKTHGIPLSAVTPLAGRDGKGKSRLATFMAVKWVVEHEIPTLYFPTEDTAGRFVKNFSASWGEYDGFRLSHRPNQEFVDMHTGFMNRVPTLPIYIHDRPSTVSEIAAIISAHKKKYSIEAVVIDGWKDIILGDGDSQVSKEGVAMAELIIAAKKNKVAIIPVMHLRDVEDGKWISKREIRGNKQLSQSARMVIIYQDSGIPQGIKKDYGLTDEDHVVIDVCKCSYGTPTVIPLKVELERGRFVEVQRHED